MTHPTFLINDYREGTKCETQMNEALYRLKDVGLLCRRVVNTKFISCTAYTGWLNKSKLLIFSEYVNKTVKIRGTWTNTKSYRENEALSDIFTWNIYFTIVLCLNVVWLKAVNDTTADYITRQLRKHGVIKAKLCNIEYLTIEIELMLPTFKSGTIHTTI